MSGPQNTGADPLKVKVFIDYSNLWIAAKRTAAKRTAAKKNNLRTDQDHRIRCEILFLIKVIENKSGRTITASNVFIFGSDTEAGWKESKQKWTDRGYKVNFSRRNPDDKEVDVDKNMQEAIEREVDGATYIVVVSGDGDFLPVIEDAVKKGCKVAVYSQRDSLSRDFLESPGVTVVDLTNNVLDNITFVNWKIHLAARDKEKTQEKFVRVVLRMRPHSLTCEPHHEPTVEWCCHLEELVGFPYQYYWRNGSSDDLVLVFRRTNINTEQAEMRFDADEHFLDSKHDIVDVIRQEHYCDEEFELIKGESRCPHMLCCKYNGPGDCDYLHNQREQDHYKQYRRFLKRRKVQYCMRHAQGKCPESAKDCEYAHSENDALCPSCGKTGHFEYYCDDKYKTVKLEKLMCEEF